MKNRTKLLAYLQDNIKRPDTVHYYVNEIIGITFKDDNNKDVVCLNVNVIDDCKTTITLSLARKIESIYNDLPALSRANDFVKLIEQFQSNNFLSQNKEQLKDRCLSPFCDESRIKYSNYCKFHQLIPELVNCY